MTLLAKVLTGVIVVLVLGLAVLGFKYRDARAAEGKAALEAYNARAQASQSVALMGVQMAALRKLYGDSVAAVSRLVVQTKQQNDRLDDVLKQQRVALEQITATVRTLQTKVWSGPTSEDASGTRHATLDVTETPYHVHVELEIPKPPAPVIANPLVVSIDPAVLNLRLGCGAVDRNGIREARATAEGPNWLTLSIDRVEQSPDVCPSPALRSVTQPCKILFVSCPSRKVTLITGLALGAVGGYEIAARKP